MHIAIYKHIHIHNVCMYMSQVQKFLTWLYGKLSDFKLLDSVFKGRVLFFFLSTAGSNRFSACCKLLLIVQHYLCSSNVLFRMLILAW